MKTKHSMGFSLFELLAGMMVMSILMTTMFVVFNRASRISSGGDDKVDIQQSLRIGLQQMSEELEMALSLPASPTGIDRPYLLSKDDTITVDGISYNRDSIGFFIPDGNGISEVGYYIDPAGGPGAHQYDLKRVYTASSGNNVDFNITSITNPDSGEYEDSTTMGYKVCDLNFQFEYFDETTNQWKTADEWDSRDGPDGASGTNDDGQLPDFILITLGGIDRLTSIEQGNNPDNSYRKSMSTRVRLSKPRGIS